MDVISIEDVYSEKLSKIWIDHKEVNYEIISRGYCAPRTVSRKSILFVGVNPSYTLEDKQNIFYEAKPDIQYFRKFNELVNGDYETNFGINWTHLDLLFLKETKQKKIPLYFKFQAGIDFINAQLRLSQAIIEQSEPKIIVVSNTLARHFLGYDKNEHVTHWMGYKFKFDNKIGTHRITSKGNLENTPIFFSSMLSGQRALDIGSFQRLKWHIRFVLDND